MGPLLAEKISGPESVTDLFSDKQKKIDEFKAVYPQFKEDLDDTLYLLKHVYEWQPPDKAEPEPNSGSQRLGTVLANLGLMSSTKPPSGGEMEYSFKVDPKITPLSVLDRVIDELDGFPLYISGLKSKTDKYNRIAVSLASKADPADPQNRSYFGISGILYNYLLNPVSKKEKKGDSDKPTIVLSDDNFTDDESILIDLEEDEQEEKEVGGGDPAPTPPPAKKEKSKVDVMLQF